jgi:hypothetical protein
LRGQAASACDAPNHVEISIEDVSPPVVSMEGPADDSLHATHEVRFWGTIQELGSGLEAFMYCIGSGDWVPVPPGEGGTWEVTVALPDGTQVVSFRALDRDRNQGLNYTTVIVDTVAPEAIFLSPEEGSALNTTSITVRAFISAGTGTALAVVMLDGLPVEVGPDGGLSSDVPLRQEGVNIIALEAVDLAGNRVILHLHITRDTLPPTLEVDAVSTPTRTSSLTVSGWTSEGCVTVIGQGVRTGIDGRFTAPLALVEGSNLVEVVATDVAGNVARKVLAILLDTRVEGEILSPLEGDRIHGDTVSVVVRTEPFAEVQVAGRTPWAPADGEGYLVMELTDLDGGPLELRVGFRDALGNEDAVTVNVTIVPRRSTPVDDGWVPPLVITIVIVASVVAVIRWRKHRRERAPDGM